MGFLLWVCVVQGWATRCGEAGHGRVVGSLVSGWLRGPGLETRYFPVRAA